MKRWALRLRRSIDLFSAVVMAGATVATAYSAYQSSLWSSEKNRHTAQAATAVVRVGKLSNMALQRTSVHVNLFVHWVSAVRRGDGGMAAYLFDRFPEPLKAAASAWRATRPLENPAAPASPFEMPEYVLQERTDADRWEESAQRETAAAHHADSQSSRYLLFTIIYASVLFFGGISGKFRKPAIDLLVLALGGLTLLGCVAIMLSSPRL